MANQTPAQWKGPQRKPHLKSSGPFEKPHRWFCHCHSNVRSDCCCSQAAQSSSHHPADSKEWPLVCTCPSLIQQLIYFLLPWCPESGVEGWWGIGGGWAACWDRRGWRQPRQTGRWWQGSGEERIARGRQSPCWRACWDAKHSDIPKSSPNVASVTTECVLKLRAGISTLRTEPASTLSCRNRLMACATGSPTCRRFSGALSSRLTGRYVHSRSSSPALKGQHVERS